MMLISRKLVTLWRVRRADYGLVALLAALLGFATSSFASAQSATGAAPAAATPAGAASVISRDAEGRLVVRATRIAQPIRIDGRVDEEIYNQVPPITEFIQQVPKAGEPITEKSEIWVMFDDKNVYISCRFQDTHPERIVGNDMRRDSGNLNSQDRCDFSLDTMHDKRSNYLFTVTPLGGMRDGFGTDDTPNFDWNGVWDASATRTEWGWMAEAAVPFKTLRYQPGREQTWGILLRRIIRSKNEGAFIVPMNAAWGNGAINHMAEAATLVGIEAPPGARNLDIKPYAISRVTTDKVATPNVLNNFEPDGGVDVKYGLTKSLTSSFTYRTDFAEAEADDAQVNLTRFSLFFPEKREFFLEGQGLFDFGAGSGSQTGIAPTIFYTRRIGLDGSRVVPVIGGARVAGRAGAWSIGALNMETDLDKAAGTPRTNFTAIRVRHDVLRRSSVGAILTNRSVSLTAPGSNLVAGLDANLAFYQNVFFSAYYAKSQSEGRDGADQSYRTQFNYNADRYGLQLDRNVIEANFNPEVGFLRRANARRNYGSVRFSPRTNRSNRVIRKYTYQTSLEYITDNENQLETRVNDAQFETEFHNSDTISVQFTRDFEHLTEPFQIARGVRIPAGGYTFQDVQMSYMGGQQRRINGTASLTVGSFYDGTKQTATFRGRASLLPKLSVEPNISLNWVKLPAGDFTSTAVGASTVYTMTPRRFVSALLQYNSSNSTFSANIRFRWEYQLGSEMFVVYTEGRSTLPPSGMPLLNRGLVVKINHLFRM